MKTKKTMNSRKLKFFLLVFLGISISAFASNESYNKGRMNFNSGWKHYFGTPTGSPETATYSDASWENVCIPYPLKYTTRWLDRSTDKNDQATFHRDVAWYRKHFTVKADSSNQKVFLEFEGSMQVTTVYVNGKNMGTHRVCGYTPFFYDVTSVLNYSGDNVVSVLVDNRQSKDSPPDPGIKDYIQFGGLYRDVYLNILNKTHITFAWEAADAGITITTPTPSAASTNVNVLTNVKNEYATPMDVTVASTVYDGENNPVKEMSSAQSIGTGKTFTFNQTTSSPISSPKLWSPSSPYLYKVVSRVSVAGQAVDSCVTRFGVRWFSYTKANGFSLNGSPIKLQGENRHQHWPFVGEAVPNLYQEFDAKMVRSCGNNVRLSHYPNDPAFLDKCDEIGLIVDEPPPTWWAADAVTASAAWWDNLELALRRMIRRDRNHPSILIWEGYVNHGSCDTRLSAAARQEDPTRLIAQCDFAHNMCYGNLGGSSNLCSEYPSWQSNWARSTETSMYDETKQWVSYLDNCYSTPSCSGMQGWCMFDYNTFHNAYYPDNAPKSICTNGIADLYRIPKFTYFWYVAEESDTPVVFIASYWNASSIVNPLKVYSNCDSVVLFVNNVSIGKMTKDTDMSHVKHPPFSKTVTFVSGTLTAKGYKAGVIAATQTIRTPGASAALRLESDFATIPANGSDWTRIVVSAVDANGTVVPTAKDNVTFSISGAGKLIGDNPVLLEAGKLIILAQSTPVAGSMTVTATSGSLTGSTTITTTTGQTAVQYSMGSTAFVKSAQKTEKQVLMMISKETVLCAMKKLPLNSPVSVYTVNGQVLMKNRVLNKMMLEKIEKQHAGVAIVKVEYEQARK